MSSRLFAPRVFRFLAAACAFAALIANVHADTIYVTNTIDTGPDAPAPGSLRAALVAANDGDVIDARGITGTIVLRRGAATSPQLVIDKSITILGSGPGSLTVDGDYKTRVFNIRPGHTVTIDGLRIIRGHTEGAFPGGAGGGIYNDHSNLTVSNCIIGDFRTYDDYYYPGNTAFAGGGIYNNGFAGSATLTVRDSRILNNEATVGGGINNDGRGGGSATLAVINCTISNNTGRDGGGVYNLGRNVGNATAEIVDSRLEFNSAGEGGGIYNGGYDDGTAALIVTNSTLLDNTAYRLGGGIYNLGTKAGTGTVEIIASILHDNTADRGGGIYNVGTKTGTGVVEIIASTLHDNTANLLGGGIYNSGIETGTGVVEIIASTFSANSATGGGSRGGGIYNGSDDGSATLKVNASTISANSAATGGGIYNYLGAILEIGNTIMNTPPRTSGGNITNHFGTVISRGFNLSSDAVGGDATTGPGGLLNGTADQRNTSPRLGPLQDNGGPTFTYALLPGSPAIDRGNRAAIPDLSLDIDQRGYPRPGLGSVPLFKGSDGSDIGAVEMQPPHADLAISLGVDKTAAKQGDLLTYTITVLNVGPNTASNVVVTDVLSEGATFVSARANKGNVATAPGIVTWSIGAMANDETATAELVVNVIVKPKGKGTTITNTVSVVSDTLDPELDNNVDAITTSVATGGSGGKGK